MLTADQIAADPRLSHVRVFDYVDTRRRRSTAGTSSATLESDIKKYEDNSFIDWQYEYAKFERQRTKFSHSAGKFARFRNLSAKWITLLVASVATALSTLLLDYVSRLLHDFKFGICTTNAWDVREQCPKQWSDWAALIISNKFLKAVIDFAIVIGSALVLASLAYKVASTSKAITKSGISELKMVLAGLNLVGFLDIKMIVLKIISLLFTIASGFWLGYEGPLVHIACSFVDFNMSLLGRLGLGLGFMNEAVRREFVSSGFAIGIASAFNAPIGGVLFGLEQIQSFFRVDKMMWNSFICTTVGVTVLEKLHPFKEFEVNDSFKMDLKNNWLFVEAFLYIILGTICGGMGILFNRLNMRFARFRKEKIGDSVSRRLIEVLAVTVLTNLLGYFFRVSERSLSEMIQMLFTDCQDDPTSALCALESESDASEFPLKTLAVLLFVTVQGYVLAAYSYGITLPGGVLIPSLTVGALLGRFLGVFMEYIQAKFATSPVFEHCYNEKSSCVSAASYAVVGSASFFAAVTKMSVASVVIISEMTGALNYIIPIMMGVFCAKILNDLILNKSIYELWLLSSGKPYLPSDLEDTMTISELSEMTPAQLMIGLDDMVPLYDDQSLTLGELEDVPANQYGHPILKSPGNPQLVGYITSYQISEELTRIGHNRLSTSEDFVKFVGEAPPGCFSFDGVITPVEDLFVVSPGFSLLTAYEAMDKLKLSNVFVCHAGGNNHFRGILRVEEIAQLVQTAGQKSNQ